MFFPPVFASFVYYYHYYFHFDGSGLVDDSSDFLQHTIITHLCTYTNVFLFAIGDSALQTTSFLFVFVADRSIVVEFRLPFTVALSSFSLLLVLPEVCAKVEAQFLPSLNLTNWTT